MRTFQWGTESGTTVVEVFNRNHQFYVINTLQTVSEATSYLPISGTYVWKGGKYVKSYYHCWRNYYIDSNFLTITPYGQCQGNFKVVHFLFITS